MLQKAIKHFKKEDGLSLIEAMIATVIVGIGFLGVFTLTTMSQHSMVNSIARQKLQMQANEIFEIIDYDQDNIDNYNLDLTVCNEPSDGETRLYLIRAYDWCSRMNGEVGSVTEGLVRKVEITDLDDGKKAVYVLLESNNGSVQIAMKRVFDGE